MNDSFSLYEFIKSLTIPDIATFLLSWLVGLICLGGIIFAFIRRKRHKFVSIITIIMLLLMAVSTITLPFLRLYSVEKTMTSIQGDETEKREIENREKRQLTEEERLSIQSDKLQRIVMYERGIPSIFSAIEYSIQLVLLVLLLIAIFQGLAKANPSGENN